MTVVVAYKYARDPGDASVGVEGDIDWSRARPAIHPDDQAAVELARLVAEASGADAVGVTVGGAAAGTPQARKAVASRGLSRLLLVADDAALGWDAAGVASALAALVQRVPDARIVVTGDASVDEGAGIVPGLLAAHLGWMCLADVSQVVPEGAGWRVTQALPEGTRTVLTETPVVVACTPDAVVPPVPGMRALLAAGSVPVEIVDAAALPATGTPALVVSRARTPERVRLHRRFTGERAAADLVAALRADGVIG